MRTYTYASLCIDQNNNVGIEDYEKYMFYILWIVKTVWSTKRSEENYSVLCIKLLEEGYQTTHEKISVKWSGKITCIRMLQFGTGERQKGLTWTELTSLTSLQQLVVPTIYP